MPKWNLKTPSQRQAARGYGLAHDATGWEAVDNLSTPYRSVWRKKPTSDELSALRNPSFDQGDGVVPWVARGGDTSPDIDLEIFDMTGFKYDPADGYLYAFDAPNSEPDNYWSNGWNYLNFVPAALAGGAAIGEIAAGAGAGAGTGAGGGAVISGAGAAQPALAIGGAGSFGGATVAGGSVLPSWLTAQNVIGAAGIGAFAANLSGASGSGLDANLLKEPAGEPIKPDPSPTPKPDPSPTPKPDEMPKFEIPKFEMPSFTMPEWPKFEMPQLPAYPTIPTQGASSVTAKSSTVDRSKIRKLTLLSNQNKSVASAKLGNTSSGSTAGKKRLLG